MARLIAILISQKDSPALTRATLASMLSAGAKLTAAGQGRAGYGFDALIDQGGGQFYGQKGGSWNCCGAILQFNKPQGWGFALLQASDGPQKPALIHTHFGVSGFSPSHENCAEYRLGFGRPLP